MEDSKLLPPGIRDPSRRVLTNTGVKDKATIEKYGAETNEKYGSYREELSPATGTLGVVLRDSTLTFKTGGTTVIPIGTKHRFFNLGGGDRQVSGQGRACT
ncbi:uncharacterized protein K444DRAFT_421641 [Hyaloscypha bicolor E]|uniref:Uncharacterized protein n=1 Tax=Hyaloscypha bicolor E TaxID=1095630 RepID=A0A2J6T7N7_9HELO|nr:uncharacterized protein K444DRAFT_421641 [Hyaloscypha bicolor E]PMD59037.1 hypothetical protein K444DRAFT_421641 [Hyaloscypha bicolor E]